MTYYEFAAKFLCRPKRRHCLYQKIDSIPYWGLDKVIKCKDSLDRLTRSLELADVARIVREQEEEKSKRLVPILEAKIKENVEQHGTLKICTGCGALSDGSSLLDEVLKEAKVEEFYFKCGLVLVIRPGQVTCNDVVVYNYPKEKIENGIIDCHDFEWNITYSDNIYQKAADNTFLRNEEWEADEFFRIPMYYYGQRVVLPSGRIGTIKDYIRRDLNTPWGWTYLHDYYTIRFGNDDNIYMWSYKNICRLAYSDEEETCVFKTGISPQHPKEYFLNHPALKGLYYTFEN